MQKIIYTLFIYLIFFALTYSNFLTKEKKKSKRNIRAFVLLASALMFRLLISTYIEGHTTDISCFKSWATRLAQVGPKEFYAPGVFADYPPGYMLVLYALGKISHLFGLEGAMKGFTLLIKLPSIFADAALGWIIYRHAKEELTGSSALLLSTLIVFSPLIILSSAIWGQIDSFFSLFMILSLIAVYKKKYYKGAFLYAVCMLIKPQAFLIAPVYLCAYIAEKDIKLIAKSIGIGLATVFITALPFTSGLNFTWLIEKYAATLKSYPYATINAYNFYALLGYNWKDISEKLFAIPISVWSYIVILAVTGGSVWFYIKSKAPAKIFYMAYLIIAIMFVFGAKMHERYLFPALLLLAVTFIFTGERRILFLLIAQTCANYLNVGDVLVSDLAKDSVTPWVIVISSLLHIAAAIYSLYLAKEIFLPQKSVSEAPVTRQYLQNRQLVRIDYILMAAITVVYGVVAFTNLGDTTAPQTFGKVQKESVVDLGVQRDIGSVMLYAGIGSGKYSIEYSADAQEWQEYSPEEQVSVFAWKKARRTADARYIKITSDGELSFGEIGVFDENGERLGISAASPFLADEQSIVPQKPSYLNGTYFDEIYHPRTAYEIIHKLAPYEITHPPLGKLILSIGIMLFGMTPFGWRFMGTLTGVIMLPLFYLICKRLVKRTDISAIATVLFAFDFMHYSQTRLATVDSYAVLFVMLAFYFAYEYYSYDFSGEPLSKGLKWLALCGASFGLGGAVKWNCLYFAPAIAVIIIIAWIKAYFESKNKEDYKKRLIKTTLSCILFFAALPSLIYFASYIPQIRYDLHGRTPLEYVVQNAKYMYNYHSTLNEPHGYASKWFEWMLNKRPLWAYIDGELKEKGIVSSIASFGNPIVWWGGFVSIIYCIYLGIFKRNVNAVILLTCYASLILPWVGITRVSFIYHYFTCVPFIVFAAAIFIKHLNEDKGININRFYGLCGAALLLFVMFYPVISGSPAPKWYVKDVLTWFSSWTFVN